VIGATTEDAFAAAWIALQGAYPEPEFAATIAYLENEWLAIRRNSSMLGQIIISTLAIEPPQRRKGLMR